MITLDGVDHVPKSPAVGLASNVFEHIAWNQCIELAANICKFNNIYYGPKIFITCKKVIHYFQTASKQFSNITLDPNCIVQCCNIFMKFTLVFLYLLLTPTQYFHF